MLLAVRANIMRLDYGNQWGIWYFSAEFVPHDPGIVCNLWRRWNFKAEVIWLNKNQQIMVAIMSSLSSRQRKPLDQRNTNCIVEEL